MAKVIEVNGVKLTVLRLNQLCILEEFQRRLSPAKVRNVAKTYDDDYFGTLSVCLVPGEKNVYHVANGQHRYKGKIKWALANGINLEDLEIPVVISENKTPASLFCGNNGNMSSPAKIDLFRIAWHDLKLRKKSGPQTIIMNGLKRHGISVQFKSGRPAMGFTKSPHCFEDVLEACGGGSAAFNQAVGCLSLCFDRPDGTHVEEKALTGDFILGYAKFLSGTGVAIGTIESALLADGICSADMVARANKARGENRWKIYDMIAKQFELAVNRGLKKMAAQIQQAA